jgi:hypothetical protein
MLTETINDELTIRVPDGFEVMSQEDLAAAYGDVKDKSEKWGMRDRDRHIMITVRWDHHSSMRMKLINVEATATAQQKTTARLYAKSDYHLIDTFTRTVAATEAAGYALTYTVEGITQAATLMWLKGKNDVYGISAFSRPEHDQSPAVIEEILDSITFA